MNETSQYYSINIGIDVWREAYALPYPISDIDVRPSGQPACVQDQFETEY